MLGRVCSLSLALICVAACATGVVEEEEPTDEGSGGNGGVGNTGAGGSGATTGGSGGSATGSCGDGVLDPGEQCDGNDLAGQQCADLGFMYGVLRCDPAICALDATECFSQICPNGVAEPGEECDGADLGGQTCQSLGFNAGTLSCDANCMYQGCSDAFVDDFESGASFMAGWTTSGQANWFVSTTTPHDGVYCAESGNINDYDTSTLSRTMTFGPNGSISFWHAESTESNYDYLRFYIDNVMQGEWDGITGWTQSSYPVAQGTHTLEWRYEKDISISQGADAVYIDDVVAIDGI